MMADDGRSSDARTAMRYHMRRTVPAREQSYLPCDRRFLLPRLPTTEMLTPFLQQHVAACDDGIRDFSSRASMLCQSTTRFVKLLNYNIEELFTESAML